MQNPLEIIVTTRKNPEPQKMKFESLFPLRDQLVSVMLLWNTNSYYVHADNRVLMINGGRRLEFPNLSECEVLYRRRNTMSVTVTGPETDPERSVSWILGLKEKDGDGVVAVVVTDDGMSWSMTNKL